MSNCFQDIFLNFTILYFFHDKDFELPQHQQFQIALIRAVVNYAIEDVPQNSLQYFYNEKFLMANDPLVFVKVSNFC